MPWRRLSLVSFPGIKHQGHDSPETETNIAPSSDLFKPMIITPMSTATKAVAQFAADESLTGKIAEVHGEHVTFAEPPPYVDEDTGKNIETFWNLGYA
jgi:hypothetical protein